MMNYELIQKFLLILKIENGLSKNTIISYENDLKKLSLFLKSLKKDFIAANENNFLSFLEDLYQKNISPNTISRKISSIKNFFKFLKEEKIRSDDPAKNLINPKKEEKIPNVLTEKEIFSLLDTAYKDKSEFGVRVSAMLEILYASGMRISELVSLPISSIGKNIDKNGNIKLKNYLIITGKGNKERIVPLNSKSIDILGKYLNLRDRMGNGDSKWLFCGDIRTSKKDILRNRNDIISKDRHITRQRFHQIIKELAKKSGINPIIVSAHIIRHSFATHLLNNNIDLRTLQELLGHSDISTTQIYTHIMESKLQELIKKHPLMNE